MIKRCWDNRAGFEQKMSRRQYTVGEDQAINAYVLGRDPLVRGNRIWNQVQLNKVSKKYQLYT